MPNTRRTFLQSAALAAGITGAGAGAETVFESIKPIDGIFGGMFPRTKDEVRENAERVRRILLRG